MKKATLLAAALCLSLPAALPAAAQFIQTPAQMERVDEMMRRNMTIDAPDITLAELARMLSSREIRVVASPKIDPKLRVSIESHEIPLAVLLATVARSNDLALAPIPGPGIEIRPWPTLQVDGRTEVLRGRRAPWTDEWPVALDPLLATTLDAVPLNRPFAAAGPGGFGSGGPEPRYLVHPPHMGLLLPEISVLDADRLLLVEPAGNANRAGWMLTLYSATAAGLRRLSSTVHAAAIPYPGTRTRPPGPPGTRILPAPGPPPPPPNAPEPAPGAAPGPAPARSPGPNRAAPPGPAGGSIGARGSGERRLRNPAPPAGGFAGALARPWLQRGPGLQFTPLGHGRAVAVEHAQENGRAGWRLSLYQAGERGLMLVGQIFHRPAMPGEIVPRRP